MWKNIIVFYTLQLYVFTYEAEKEKIYSPKTFKNYNVLGIMCNIIHINSDIIRFMTHYFTNSIICLRLEVQR